MLPVSAQHSSKPITTTGQKARCPYGIRLTSSLIKVILYMSFVRQMSGQVVSHDTGPSRSSGSCSHTEHHTILLAMTSPGLVSAVAMSSAQTTPLPNIHHSSPVGSCRIFNCDLRLRLPTKCFSLRGKSSTTTTRRCQDQGKTLASPVCMLEGLSVSSVDHYSKIASSSPLSLGAYLLLSSFRVPSR